MSAVKLTHSNESHEIRQPLKWRAAVLDGDMAVWATCGNGHEALLNHSVDAEGNVSPSLCCPEGGCDWHEWVRLEGWTGGDRSFQEPSGGTPRR